MTNPTQIARDRFAEGFNCSQAVFCAYAPKFGINEEAALKIASPFGGGVAHQGQVCGAVTGALMAIGLARGNATLDQKDETYRLAEEYLERFQERHGTILCRELIGVDISTPEGLQRAREQDVFKSICPRLVQDATELVEEFIGE
jgi:C_GCAxxG_C_C family probable redox protein